MRKQSNGVSRAVQVLTTGIALFIQWLWPSKRVLWEILRDINSERPNKLLVRCTWNVPANLDDVVSISEAGVLICAVGVGLDVALYSCCSSCSILLCIKSRLRAGIWAASVAGEAGSAAVVADESGHGGVADAATLRTCPGARRRSGWIDRGPGRAGCGS